MTYFETLRKCSNVPSRCSAPLRVDGRGGCRRLRQFQAPPEVLLHHGTAAAAAAAAATFPRGADGQESVRGNTGSSNGMAFLSLSGDFPWDVSEIPSEMITGSQNVRFAVVVGILITTFDNVLMARIVEHLNLPMNGL